MALSDSSLSSALKAIFDAMDAAAADSPKNNQWYADQMAKAIDDQIKTAEVQVGISVDGGTASGGNLVGAKTSALGSIK